MWLVRGCVGLLVILSNVQRIRTTIAQFFVQEDTDTSYDIVTSSFYDSSTTIREKSGSLPHRCQWLQECICRNESDYTNGTFKLMVNCTKSGLKDVPEFIPSVTTVLTLDGNQIEDIKPGAFKNLKILKYLDLSNNVIHRLNEHTFLGLENLHTLELSGNMIRYDNNSLPNTVFKPLKKLERLNLHQRISDVNTSIEYYPTKALSKLKSLRQLLIDGIEPKNISQAFSNMALLMTLDLSSDCGRCRLRKIVVDMFKNINSVYDLKISNCSLDFVEKGSFKELENLTILDLSHNEQLQFKSLANITYGLQKKVMREIKLIKIHETFGDCTRIEKEHLQYFQNVNVTNLYVDFNRLAYVNEDAVTHIPRSLQKLSLTNNMLLAGEYIHKMFKESVFKNLKFLTMAEQSMNYDAVKFFDNKTRHMLSSMTRSDVTYRFEKGFDHERHEKENFAVTTNKTRGDDNLEFCSNCHARGVYYETILYIPPGLKDLDLSGLQIRNELKNICFCENNSLLRMNLERNVFWNWQGPIAGLSNLLNLNLAWNSCDNLSEDFFDQFINLTQLNLTRNFIERFLRNDIEGRIFRNLKKLFSLVLIDNKIRYIPPKLFQGLESLGVLDLSFNFLTEIDLEFNIHPLQFLDLHNNLLNKIGPGIIKKFNNDSKGDLPYQFLDLRNNRLSCACKDIDFVQFIARTKVTLRGLNEYTCTYKNGSTQRLSSQKLASVIYMRLSKDCADYTWVIIGACFGIVLFLVIAFGGLIHRYRWDLKYLYYTIKLKMKGNKQFTNQNDEGTFKYDAFISYANESSLFVMNSLIPALEETRHLKLLVHGRDFMAGEYVYDNIMRAIKTSRKTLILMSEPFLKSQWCIFEMNMARLESIKTGRNAVCIVMLERISSSGLPLELIDIIRQQTYLELPTDSQETSTEWDRIHSALVD